MVAARGTSIVPNAPGPARSRRAWSSGSSGRGNGSRSIVTNESEGPGTSMPCQKLIVANRQVSGSRAKRSMSAGLGRSPWASMGNGSRPRRASTARCMAL